MTLLAIASKIYHRHYEHFFKFRHRHGCPPVSFFNRDEPFGFGPEHGRDHGGRHRGRGGPGRFFESGDLRFVILHLISDAPRHGYEIIKLIENLMAGAHSPSPGIVYPTLTLLEEMGHAAVKVEGTRKLYTITDDGRQELAAHRVAVDAILQRMTRAGEQHTQDRPASIVRAMENLRMVLRMRACRLTPEQVAAVTDIIDGAAKQIERV